MASFPSEHLARELLCRELPVLRKRARHLGREGDLEAVVTEIQHGASLAPALQQITEALYGDTPDRSPFMSGADSSHAGLLPPPERVTGRYVCPDGRCSRRSGLDPLNRPPWCSLAGQPMAFTD